MFMLWKKVAIGAALMSGGWSAGCAQAQNTKPPGAASVTAAPITAYANNGAEVVLSRAGKEYLRFGWMLWGPGWAWTGLEGQTTAKNGVSTGEMKGKLGGTQTPVTIAFRAEKTGPRTLKITYSASVETDSPLTMIAVGFTPGEALMAVRRKSPRKAAPEPSMCLLVAKCWAKGCKAFGSLMPPSVSQP
jgi:hypothetical protein